MCEPPSTTMMPGTIRPKRLSACVSVFGALVFSWNCAAQITAPTSAPATAPTSAPATQGPPATQAASPSDEVNELTLMRPPLLRESSRLVEARGVMKRDPATNWWVFELEPQDVAFAALGEGRDIPPYELILLPTTTLSEMQRVFESTAGSGRRVTFEVTGQVLVYRGRNYALITHAGRLTHDAPATTLPAVSAAQASTPTAATAPASAPSASQPASDSIDDIKRGLEQSLERVPEHISASDASASESQDSATPSRLGFTVDAAALSSPTASAHGTEKALREGTAVQSRRGKITRDSAGAWLFIFDADATGISESTEGAGETTSGGGGGGDPPMRLLPCLLLEKIEEYARRNPITAPVLITGEVYLYQGRNYLLPTVFRVPQDRTKISP